VVAIGRPSRVPDTTSSITLRSSGERASSSTEGTSRSFARGPAWTMTAILLSLSHAALVAFQLDQVLLRASTSPRSIARLISLPPA
jgi:hypothetical protein